MTITTTGEQRISIALGEGVYLDVDVDINGFALSGPVVPKPKPKTTARLIVDINDACDECATPMPVEIKVAVAHRR
ncbi:hypothetical protein [Pseudoxanthomonas suwonensis]|jgi:hypothetical protein|uniref:hypothetical protein n=1 Tax=Pseudoxanthomonas suwonensis TaxID=314722 RepID=UPI000467242C|nr:hypothetical protein [Pseudoxanthomonas suwonensis]